MNVAAPISRPAYTTTKGVDYAQWIADNEDSLHEWYRMTSEWEPAQHPADYADFVSCQFDIACEDDSSAASTTAKHTAVGKPRAHWPRNRRVCSAN